MKVVALQILVALSYSALALPVHKSAVCIDKHHQVALPAAPHTPVLPSEVDHEPPSPLSEPSIEQEVFSKPGEEATTATESKGSIPSYVPRDIQEIFAINPQFAFVTAMKQLERKDNPRTILWLLATEKVDPAGDFNFAIQRACSVGHYFIVYTLLSYPEVDPSANYDHCIKAAADNMDSSVVQLLIESNRVNPAAGKNQPLNDALWNGDRATVLHLLHHPDVLAGKITKPMERMLGDILGREWTKWKMDRQRLLMEREFGSMKTAQEEEKASAKDETWDLFESLVL